jgi:poly-gamma-glutamate capsule biosynthesis protein CapA/YwtB (metallophosphatase superfamily)
MDNNSNKFNKTDFQEVVKNLNGTAISLLDFFTKVKNDLPEEEKKKIDKELSKSEHDLKKIISDLANLKI